MVRFILCLLIFFINFFFEAVENKTRDPFNKIEKFKEMEFIIKGIITCEDKKIFSICVNDNETYSVSLGENFGKFCKLIEITENEIVIQNLLTKEKKIMNYS